MNALTTQTPLYAVADAFQLDLFFDTNGAAQGGRAVNRHIGGWAVQCSVQAESDVLTPQRAGVFVKIRKSCWFYAVSAPMEGKLYLFLFDATAAGIKTNMAYKFSAGTIAGTLEKLAPHIRGGFLSLEGSATWEPLSEPFDFAAIGGVDQGQQGAGAPVAGTSP